MTLCNSMDCGMPGFPVLHYLQEFAQIHVHWDGDAIQPSHPLPPSSPFAFNLSQHQGLFQWVDFLHQVAKVLELQHSSIACAFHICTRPLLLIKCHVTIGRVPVADTSKQPCEIRTAMCGSVTYVWDLHWFHIWPQMSDPGEVTYKCSCAEEWVWYFSRWIICTFFRGVGYLVEMILHVQCSRSLPLEMSWQRVTTYVLPWPVWEKILCET